MVKRLQKALYLMVGVAFSIFLSATAQERKLNAVLWLGKSGSQPVVFENSARYLATILASKGFAITYLRPDQSLGEQRAIVAKTARATSADGQFFLFIFA